MIPTLIKKPIESLRYITHALVPSLAILYLEHEYEKTGEETILETHRYFCEKLMNVVVETYPIKEQLPRILNEVESLHRSLQDIDNITNRI
ncbi:MAG: hypothetical protein ABIF40_02960 [archaeon]